MSCGRLSWAIVLGLTLAGGARSARAESPGTPAGTPAAGADAPAPGADAPAPGADGPASGPSSGAAASPAPGDLPAAGAWGESRSGFRVAAAVEGEAIAGQRLRIRGFLRNDAVAAVSTRGAFAWVLLASDRNAAFYSQQFPLPELLPEASIPAGKTAALEIKLDAALGQASRKGMKIRDGYPEAAEGTGPQKLMASLSPGRLRLQVLVYLPSAGGEKLLLKSAPVTISLLAKGSELAGSRSLAELAAAFRRDPFAAKNAHDQCVQMGAAARPMLAEIARDASAPDFARSWATATVADIGGEESATILVDLLKSGIEVNVIAYYGPPMKNAALDAALRRRAEKADDAVFFAWLARGQTRAGKSLPDELVEKVVSGDSQPAKFEIAEALAAEGAPRHLPLLVRLVTDRDPAVRTIAARACARHTLEQPIILQALVKSLDLGGAEAQAAACEALATATGNDWRLGEKQGEAQRAQTLERWREWGRRQPR